MLFTAPSADLSTGLADTLTVVTHDGPRRRWDLDEITAPTYGWLATVVAAVGGHHLSLTGSAGTQRMRLAHTVGRLVPDLRPREVSRVNAIWQLRLNEPQLTSHRRPPLQHWGSRATYRELIGEENTPGAVSLTHHGVLLLEQAGNLGSAAVKALEQAMATGEVTPQPGTSRYPAAFQAVLAQRPCGCRPQLLRHAPGPCGDQSTYLANLATLTKFADLHIDLDTAPPCPHYGIEDSSLNDLRHLVAAATWRARVRLRHVGVRRTADLRGSQLAHPRWDTPALARLRRRLRHRRITAEQHAAVTRVALTLADLAGRIGPDQTDVRTAALLHGITL